MDFWKRVDNRVARGGEGSRGWVDKNEDNSLSLSLSRGAIKNLITNRIDNTRRLRANEFPRNSLYPLTFPVRNINSFRSSKLHRLSTRPFPPPPRHFNYKLIAGGLRGDEFLKSSTGEEGSYLKVFGENIFDRCDILDPIPESKIFGRKGRGRACIFEGSSMYHRANNTREREREGMGPTILFERLFITY